MFACGFILILANAAGYVFHVWESSPALTVIGLVCVAVGAGISKNRQEG